MKMLDEPAPRSTLEWKRLLRDYGVETVNCAARCRDAALDSSCCRELRAILKSGECYSMKQLAVNGDHGTLSEVAAYKLSLLSPAYDVDKISLALLALLDIVAVNGNAEAGHADSGSGRFQLRVRHESAHQNHSV
jgi:hypothetical protein